MFTIDEISDMLDGAATELPEEFYRELNGGISLLPETKMRDDPIASDLYILGEYHNDAMGRYIVIYYGSLSRVFPHYTAEQMQARLKQLLIHEFTHHLESLAGEHGLEDKDQEQLDGYRRRGLET
jgi:predicted Zn-dependent protease with MMP-like domain